jgi:hypothetical protein
MLDQIVVTEPDLLAFELWLASNPDEEAVRRWLMAVEAYYARREVANA